MEEQILPTNNFIDEFCDAFGTEKFSWWMTNPDNEKKLCTYAIEENNKICNTEKSYENLLAIFVRFRKVVMEELPRPTVSVHQLILDAITAIKKLQRERIRLETLLEKERQRSFMHFLNRF